MEPISQAVVKEYWCSLSFPVATSNVNNFVPSELNISECWVFPEDKSENVYSLYPSVFEDAW